LGRKAEIHTYFHQLNGSMLLAVVNSINDQRAATLQPDLEFYNFKRHPKHAFFGLTVRLLAVMIEIF
jgi:hypothetical protein